jgi:GNAT superfamily N-acetyltransferase
MTKLGNFELRRATNRDVEPIWLLISDVLKSYGITTDKRTTDGDLLDIDGNFWQDGGAFFVLLDHDTIIGTLALRKVSDYSCELCRMYLASDYRGRGLGIELLDHAVLEAKNRGYREMLLKTASVLKEAISLYQKAGFRTDCSASADGNCDLVMRKQLS